MLCTKPQELNSFTIVYKVNEDTEKREWALVSPQEIDGIGDVSAGGSTYHSAIESSEKGNPIRNLPDGEYQLVEVAAPDGYVIEKAAWVFTISDGKITVGAYQTGMDTAVIVIPNTQGVELPATGGEGVTAFVLLGGTMTLGAGAILLLRRRDTA